LVVIHCRYVNIGVEEKKRKELNVDLHSTPFLSLANVIGDENIKVKSWDVKRIPTAQQAIELPFPVKTFSGIISIYFFLTSKVGYFLYCRKHY
jgi:hypothetical protein